MPHTSREIHFASQPTGEPTAENFRLVEVDVPEPADGQVLIRNTFMSVDPGMRSRMAGVETYVEPFKVGEVLSGSAVGEVIASESPDAPVGSTVLHFAGWRELALLKAKHLRVVDPALASSYLGALGTPGLTAYVGLLDIGELRDGDVVFVSGAAGAVGSIAGQIAKLRGHTVIGSAGGPEKCRHLVENLGFDAAIDYRQGDIEGQLRAAAPDGINVYFDNVGGEHLDAALSVMCPFGRVVLSGSISGYNETELPPGPANIVLAVVKRITLRGFIAFDHADRREAFESEVGAWIADGKLVARETVIEGVARAPEALAGLWTGANIGKMLVKLS